MRIYIIRHGQAGQERGSELSSDGLRQTKAVARVIHELSETQAVSLRAGPTPRMVRSLEIIRDECPSCHISFEITGSLDQVPQIVFDQYLKELEWDHSDEARRVHRIISVPGLRDEDRDPWDSFLRSALNRWSLGRLDVGGKTLQWYQAMINEYFDAKVQAAFIEGKTPVFLAPAGVIETILRRVIGISEGIPFGSLNTNFYHGGISRLSKQRLDSPLVLDFFNEVSHLTNSGTPVTFR